MPNFLLTTDTNNTYIQSGASATPGSTAPIIFTGMGGSPELMRITADGKLIIGGVTPDGSLLQVGCAALVVDQQQVVSSSYSTYTDNFQTFVSGVTGILAGITLYVATDYTGTLEIREGAGLSGGLLSSKALTALPSSGASTVDIPWCNLISGNTYTIALRGSSDWRGSATDVYPDGYSPSGGDRYFVTLMRSATPTNLMSVDSSSLVTNQTIVQNSVNTKYIKQDLVDDEAVSFPVSGYGWGYFQVGNNAEYSRFMFNQVGAGVTGVYQSSNVAYNAATDGYFCIQCSGGNLIITNKLGATATIRGELNW